MNRYAIFPVTPEVLVGMAQHAEPYTVQIIENRLPADAEIVGVNYNHERRCFDITLESSEFGEVPEGAKIPFLAPTSFRRLEMLEARLEEPNDDPQHKIANMSAFIASQDAEIKRLEVERDKWVQESREWESAANGLKRRIRDTSQREVHLRSFIAEMLNHAQVLRVNQVQMAAHLKKWPKSAIENCDRAWKALNGIDKAVAIQ